MSLHFVDSYKVKIIDDMQYKISSRTVIRLSSGNKKALLSL